MKLKKKTSMKYNLGGVLKKKKKDGESKVVKAPKNEVTQKAGLTAEGDKMPMLRKSTQLNEATRNRGADVADIKVNVTEANAKIKSVMASYQALSAEDRSGAKGKAMKNQLRILRDSTRGHAKKQAGTKQNAKGQYYD
jgi:hypothetical protein